jgi:hypothetical protein
MKHEGVKVEPGCFDIVQERNDGIGIHAGRGRIGARQTIGLLSRNEVCGRRSAALHEIVRHRFSCYLKNGMWLWLSAVLHFRAFALCTRSIFGRRDMQMRASRDARCNRALKEAVSTDHT